MSKFIIYFFAFFCLLSIVYIWSMLKDDEEFIATLSPKEYYQSSKLQSQLPRNFSQNDSETETNKLQETIMNEEKLKYITCNYYEPGGFGYQLWRFASLYGLGRLTNRLPYMDGQNFLQMINFKELGKVFPLLYEVIKIKLPPSEIVEDGDYGEDDRDVENLEKLLKFHNKYLKIRGNYLQSYKYFENYQNEIKNIFQCSPTLKSNIDYIAEELFKNDTNFKLCAHIRRNEFLNNTMLESKEDFIYPAIDYAYQNFKDKRNVSLLLLGDDKEFMESLAFKNDISKIYIPKQQSRGEDMCLGINYCDAMVMTASGSAFGWWISYLMKPNSTIFYNSQISDKGMSLKDIYDFDLFPENWIKLSIINGKAHKEEKWWRQRHG